MAKWSPKSALARRARGRSSNNGGRGVSDCHSRDDRPDGKLAWRSGKTAHGKLSVKQLQGFVGIAVRAGEAVQSGPVDTIQLMAVISLNLGVLNFAADSDSGWRTYFAAFN